MAATYQLLPCNEPRPADLDPKHKVEPFPGIWKVLLGHADPNDRLGLVLDDPSDDRYHLPQDQSGDEG